MEQVLEDSFSIGLGVGFMTTTWPMASLHVSPSCLRIGGLVSYTFSPEEVESIEYVSHTPLWSAGLRIRHLREDYHDKLVILGMLGSEAKIVEAIVQSGFLPAERVGIRPAAPPLRAGVLPILILLCALPAFLALFTGIKVGTLGMLAWTASFGLLTSSGLRLSSMVQEVLLRPGREGGEIEVPLFVAQIVSVVMLFAVAALWLAGKLAAA